MLIPYDSRLTISTINSSDVTKYTIGIKLSIHGPRQANLVLIAYASSESSGEPTHPRSLARTSAARSYKQWVKRNRQTESQILAPLDGWACAVKIYHDGMLEDTNSLDGAQIINKINRHNCKKIFIEILKKITFIFTQNVAQLHTTTQSLFEFKNRSLMDNIQE